MSENKNGLKIFFIILLGALLALLSILLFLLRMEKKTGTLSQEKMSAMKNSMEYGYSANDYDEEADEETDYTAEIPAFHISAQTWTGHSAEGRKENVGIADDIEQGQDAEINMDSEHICSYSSDSLLDESDIEGLKQNAAGASWPDGESVIQMAINEIYARYGYRFKSEAVQRYFESRQWYQDIDGRFEDMEVVFGKMTELEQANVKFLSAHTGD